MSRILRGLGNFVAVVGGLVGFILSLLVVASIFGGSGVILGLLFFPVVFAVIPFYMLFVYGSWNLLLINYGSVLVYWVLHRVAGNMDSSTKPKEQPKELVTLPPVATPIPIPETIHAQTDQTPKNHALNGLTFIFVLLVLTMIFLAVKAANTPSPALRMQPTSLSLPTGTTTRSIIPTKTLQPTILHGCVSSGTTIRIRKGPGTNYEVIGGLTSEACADIVARNADSSWVYIWTDDNRFGWVAASLLTIEGDLERVSLQSSADALSLAPTVKAMPTQTLIPTQKLIPTSTHKPFVFITSTPVQSVLLCSQTANKIGKYVSCKIERAYCDYLPSVDGAPTFCDDRPYPNQNFQLVVFGADWSGYDGYCIMVSGTVSLYRGIPQILATRRSQVSYCQ